jgi:hypothetical protein
MSRSYKQAVLKSTVRGFKRFASKAVRNFPADIPDGNWYRRIYNSYNSCDVAIDQRWEMDDSWNSRNPRMRRARRSRLWLISK